MALLRCESTLPSRVGARDLAHTGSNRILSSTFRRTVSQGDLHRFIESLSAAWHHLCHSVVKVGYRVARPLNERSCDVRTHESDEAGPMSRSLTGRDGHYEQSRATSDMVIDIFRHRSVTHDFRATDIVSPPGTQCMQPLESPVTLCIP